MSAVLFKSGLDRYMNIQFATEREGLNNIVIHVREGRGYRSSCEVGLLLGRGAHFGRREQRYGWAQLVSRSGWQTEQLQSKEDSGSAMSLLSEAGEENPHW